MDRRLVVLCSFLAGCALGEPEETCGGEFISFVVELNVVDAETAAPLTAAEVRFTFEGGPERTATSNEDDVVILTSTDPGVFHVTVTMEGYEPFEGDYSVDWADEETCQTGREVDTVELEASRERGTSSGPGVRSTRNARTASLRLPPRG